MEDRIRTDRTVILIVTISSLGLILKCLRDSWEFYIPLIAIGGTIGMWVLHIAQYADYRFREGYYLAFVMILAFFHGIHAQSFFDVSIIACAIFVTFSTLDRPRMLNYVMIEYVLLMVIQIVINASASLIVFDASVLSRVFTHALVVLAVFYVCRKAVFNRLSFYDVLKERDDRIASARNDTEDFLTNVSHELRTPVNVVNGMSTLMLKDTARDEVKSIKDAGIRLSRQLDDIYGNGRQ